MSKVLITGGSGFIGTHIIESLLKNGNEVLNIDLADPKIKEHTAFWTKLDICDRKQVCKIIKEFSPEYVIHLAARTDLNGKVLDDYKANIDGVNNILEALESLSNLKGVIFTSSMYVCRPGYKPLNFDDYSPHTVYGESKVLTEKLIKEKNPSYKWSIIRPTSIWGPYFGEPYNLFFKIVLSGKYFHLGKRACKKTYGYIDNTVYQILAIMNASNEKVYKKTYYLGDYQPYNISEWADEIAEFVNMKIPTIPYFLFQLAAGFGDIIKMLGGKFPMTSFRLKNMTTDNVHDLSLIQKLAPKLPVQRKEGTMGTINWIKNN